MVKTLLIWLCLQATVCTLFAQSAAPDSLGADKRRILLVAGSNAVFFTGAYIALDKAWYDGYERSSFHFFDDLPEWNQMDKMGHVWTTYQVSRGAAEAWKWTGMKRNTAALLGAATGIIYESVIEIQDGYSDKWGFSWSDMGANIIGAGLFAAQDIGWRQQKISVKMSFWPQQYPVELVARRNDLFGHSPAERILKDYNSQTYWVSANLSSMFEGSRIPSWLNIAAGYGADGLLGGRENKWTDGEGFAFDYTGIPRQRKYYLSLDADLTRIKTKKKLLKTVFFLLNAVKIPAPALEMSNRGQLRLLIR